jgi:hypothetical protein
MPHDTLLSNDHQIESYLHDCACGLPAHYILSKSVDMSSSQVLRTNPLCCYVVNRHVTPPLTSTNKQLLAIQ